MEKILIIGGTSGIGRALAEHYCILGAHVIVVGRRANLLKELHTKYPVNIHTVCADVSKDYSIEKISSAVDLAGGIEKCIVCASVVHLDEKLNKNTELETVLINVYGFVSIINYAYRYFLEKGSGQIVAITSVAAARGNKHSPAYNASKSFQSFYLEGLRLKVSGNKNITITEIIPGYVDTQMAKGDRIFWLTSLNKAVRQIKQGIDKRTDRVFISKRWKIIFLLYKFLPPFLYKSLINSKIKFKKIAKTAAKFNL